MVSAGSGAVESAHSEHSFTPRQKPAQINVSYLTSSQYQRHVLHFFQTVENAAMKIDNVHRQRRIFAIVDDAGNYTTDLHLGVTRCVLVSKIEEVVLPEHDSNVLHGPFTEYDVICQGSSALDFIRTVGALYTPNVPGNKMILLQLDEGLEPPVRRVRCSVFGGARQSALPPEAQAGAPLTASPLKPLHAPPPPPLGLFHPGQPPPPPYPPTGQHSRSPVDTSFVKDVNDLYAINEGLRRRVQELSDQVTVKNSAQESTEMALKKEIHTLQDELHKLQKFVAGTQHPTNPSPHRLWYQPQNFRTQPSGAWMGDQYSTVPFSQPPPPSSPPPAWVEPVRIGSSAGHPTASELYGQKGLSPIKNTKSTSPPLFNTVYSQQPQPPHSSSIWGF